MHDLLAYCESTGNWPASVAYAARLAAAFDGRVTGIHACPPPSVVSYPYDTPELMADLLKVARQIEEDAIASGPSFEAFVRARGATRVAWQVAEEELPRALKLAGNWHDLLVVGRTLQTPGGSVSAVGSMVLGTGLPCLVVPESHTGEGLPEGMAIAWNGSVEAIRATHAALPLLRRARWVTILEGEQRPPASLAYWRPPFELAAYLAAHGVHSETMFLSKPGDSEGALLLEAAKQARADMLVMGAYGHTRLSEWMLGGATRSVLEHLDMPVFMRH